MHTRIVQKHYDAEMLFIIIDWNCNKILLATRLIQNGKNCTMDANGSVPLMFR